MAVTHHFRNRTAALFALVTAVACSDDFARPDESWPPSTPPPPDKTAPLLMQRAPEVDEENVWAGAPIRLVFSEPLAPASVGASAVTLQSEAGPIPVRTTLSADGREIRAVIESPHMGPARLTATVAGTVTDVAGNAFAGTTWSWSVPLWQRPGAMPAAVAAGPLDPALALDPSDLPVIAWRDGEGGRSVIRAARIVDGRWQRLGDVLNVVADATAATPRVVVTPSDEPVVVWQESGNASHVYAKRYRGGSWELLGTGPLDAGAGNEAKSPVVAMVEGQNPVVAWIADKTRVEIRRWDGSAWKPEAAAWDAARELRHLSLVLAKGVPVVAVTAGAESTDVLVMRWSTSGASWQAVGAPLDRALANAAARPSLAVTREGLIGVAWQENDGYSDNVYAATFDEGAQSWALLGTALDVEFDAPATAPSLAFGANGTATVAWSEVHGRNARTYVGRFTGKRWEVPGAGLNQDGARTAMSAAVALDHASNPVVGWEERGEGDGEGEGGATSRLLIRRYNGGAEVRYAAIERRPPPCSFPEEGDPAFPRTLTETKCYADVPGRVPAPGLIPYDLNSPLWSDGAYKRRFLILPSGTSIGFSEKNFWQFPVGTILVKEFWLEREPGNPATLFPVETRYILKRCEPGLCRAAWEGYSYQWNDAGTEGTLLDNGNVTLFKDWPTSVGTHRHSYPGRDECRQCHVVAAGGILGLQTGQLNRNFDYGDVVDNQLRAWEHAGLFGNGGDGSDAGADAGADGAVDAGSNDEGGTDGGVDAGGSDGRGGADGGRRPMFVVDTLPRLPTPYDAAHTNAERVRSYFHSNCSHCHRPDGRWPVIDFLYDAALVGANEPNANICNELVPGNAAASFLYIKDAVREGTLPPDFTGLPMPPLATLIPDKRQLPTLKTWIDEMKTCP